MRFRFLLSLLLYSYFGFSQDCSIPIDFARIDDISVDYTSQAANNYDGVVSINVYAKTCDTCDEKVIGTIKWEFENLAANININSIVAGQNSNGGFTFNIIYAIPNNESINFSYKLSSDINLYDFSHHLQGLHSGSSTNPGRTEKGLYTYNFPTGVPSPTVVTNTGDSHVDPNNSNSPYTVGSSISSGSTISRTAANSANTLFDVEFEELPKDQVFEVSGYNRNGAAGQGIDSVGYSFGSDGEIPVDCEVILPVKLVDFVAKEQDDAQVLIEWRTASETNSDYFDIERSFDGLNFLAIQRVAAAGTTHQMSYYQIVDYLSDSSDHVFYRLKQVDFDGSYEYSDIVEVLFDNSPQFSVYPNPVRQGESFFIKASSDSSITIYNIDGEQMDGFQMMKLSDQITTINTSNFQRGIYFIRHQNSGKVQKIIIN